MTAVTSINKQKFKSELLLGFTLPAKSFSSQLKLSRLYVTEEFTCNFSKFCKWLEVFAWLWTVLTGIGVEIAKHTFSLDNFNISRICDQGREQFFFWQCSPLFSLLRTQPNNLRIFVWHHTSVSRASRILTLDASKWAVSRLLFRLIADSVRLDFAALSRITQFWLSRSHSTFSLSQTWVYLDARLKCLVWAQLLINLY